MTINYKNAILIFIIAIIISIPTGIFIQKKDSIHKTAKPNGIIFQVASATEVKPKTIEEPKQETAPEVTASIPSEVTATEPDPAPVVQRIIYSTECESYRPLVQKYFGDATDAAMITMIHESSCNPYAHSETNDFGLFQLNNQEIYDPETNISIAYQKFIHPRRGSTPNFSAWYAVCTPNLVPKYDGIWCS